MPSRIATASGRSITILSPFTCIVGLFQLHRPVCVVERGLPRLVLPVGKLEIQKRAALRLLRLADQAEVGLLGRAAALADVAAYASANYVLPGAGAALAARHHMVQAQFARRVLLTAVLALIVVAGEDIAAVELDRVLGQLLISKQPNHARHLNLAVERADPIVVFLAEVLSAIDAHFTPRLEVVTDELAFLQAHDFSQILAQEAEGTPDRDDVHGHEQLVQNQNAGVQGAAAARHDTPCPRNLAASRPVRRRFPAILEDSKPVKVRVFVIIART